jgi:hypothetical protein
LTPSADDLHDDVRSRRDDDVRAVVLRNGKPADRSDRAAAPVWKSVLPIAFPTSIPASAPPASFNALLFVFT